MKIIKCWDIQVWDGGDRCNHKYFVATKEAADAWMVKNKFDSVYEKEFIIFDDLAELDSYRKGEQRAQALAKLTLEDQVALGLI
jgi:hypothetical protein